MELFGVEVVEIRNIGQVCFNREFAKGFELLKQQYRVITRAQ